MKKLLAMLLALGLLALCACTSVSYTHLGDVPSPLNMPTGCSFRTRCRYATDQCAKECPALTDRGDGHFVACWNK